MVVLRLGGCCDPRIRLAADNAADEELDEPRERAIRLGWEPVQRGYDTLHELPDTRSFRVKLANSLRNFGDGRLHTVGHLFVAGKAHGLVRLWIAAQLGEVE